MKSSARQGRAGHGRRRDHHVPDRRHRGRRDVLQQRAPGGCEYPGSAARIPVIVESVLWGARIEDKRDPELLAFGRSRRRRIWRGRDQDCLYRRSGINASGGEGCPVPVLVLGGVRSSIPWSCWRRRARLSMRAPGRRLRPQRLAGGRSGHDVRSASGGYPQPGHRSGLIGRAGVPRAPAGLVTLGAMLWPRRAAAVGAAAHVAGEVASWASRRNRTDGRSTHT